MIGMSIQMRLSKIPGYDQREPGAVTQSRYGLLDVQH